MERTVGYVVVAVHAEDAVGRGGQVRCRREDEGIAGSGHDGVALVVWWRLCCKLIAEGLGSIHVLGIVEERGLEEATSYHIIVRGALEQVLEGILNLLRHTSLIVVGVVCLIPK